MLAQNLHRNIYELSLMSNKGEMMMKPIIGICANYSDDEEVGLLTELGMKGQEWQLLANDYITAIERAGGIPVILPITENAETCFPLLEKLDGILFSGGTDIDPQYYNDLPRYGLGAIDVKRDQHEFALAKKVLFETNLPVLGICRGIQLLTAITGGSMFQDLQRERPKGLNHTVKNIAKHHPVHPVTIKRDSLMFDIFQNECIQVNSFNHQAVKDVGEGFEVTMTAPDGLVEGIEMTGERFVCAVQWHPEMMVVKHPAYLSLFKAFVENCRRVVV